ncbi:hypothetical protein EW145_g686 [Phellinidium pouzarii]|uniref:SprT-like domain-containing protein n=1 Tax=Phellinidium pouzarii TaxID=167371 RepID=A0A4S4LHC1_9AGAM|nr:hypothetical protein EW145_g686 [Phellinidium pouzarii]
MCHLACWVINRNPKEGHGGTWNGWAYEVMEKRPDIKITTKHSYDIAYKFEWQCQGVNCKKVYGRHSKSIDPTKSSELLPLFQTRPRKNKADSKLAAGRIRDSPSTFPSLWSAGDTETPLHLEQHSDASTSASNTDRELSGLDTDTDDCVFMIEPPELSQATIRASDLDKPTKSKVSGSDSNKNHTTGNIDRALDKLVTHISIIDLTED